MSDVEFERSIAAALRSPVHMGEGARQRVMQSVRETAARTGGPRRHDRHLSLRPVRHSLVGLAMVASVGSVAVLAALPRAGRHAPERPGVIGDSVVETLRDTLRLVRLIFDDPGAREVAVVGDFNGWVTTATPMQRDRSSRRWSAVVALRDGDQRYAFVVDDARWVPDPSTTPVRDGDRLVSLLHVARARN
jgi:hypothetical protein